MAQQFHEPATNGQRVLLLRPHGIKEREKRRQGLFPTAGERGV